MDPRAVIRLVQHPDRDYRLEGALKLRISVETDEGGERFEFAEKFLDRAQGRAPSACRRQRPESESQMNDPLYFAPMTTTGRSRPRILAAALLLALTGISAMLPGAQAQTAPDPRVYTVEVIVFRNMSGAGGPEDWSVKPVARGPDTPDAPVTGQVRAVDSGGAVPAQRRRRGSCRTRLTISPSRTSPGSRPRAPGVRAPASPWPSSRATCRGSRASSISRAAPTCTSACRSTTRRPIRPTGSRPPPGTVFTLNESRRVKWDKLNYYDHPAFGVIALVTPANRATGGR